ncbi:MAG: type I 3-dehydroquinate dehydratase [Lachnospiraceae bacterium]|nr:type I 3-dehydroquinate dehydratase [Lachnospiraceae bacterium]
MSRTVQVRNLWIGEGMPKICIPLLGRTQEEILAAAANAASEVPDLLEWRVDWYEQHGDSEAVVELLFQLRQEIGTLPLLFTFRTRQDGGEAEISAEAYIRLNREAMATGMTDLVDVELSQGEEALQELIAAAHERDVAVVVSCHDFEKTPSQAEMVSIMCRMQELGADIPKLAVMPQSDSDVIALINATHEMRMEHDDTPVITMSMGVKGSITRLGGETFGSAVTFASVGQESAPGQIGITELRQMLAILYQGV